MIRQVIPGSTLNHDGLYTSPAEAGWVHGEYELVEAPPAPELLPLTLEQLRELMPKLEKWRLYAAINIDPGLWYKIRAEIAAMPEPDRTINKSKLDNLTEFDRLNPIFELIGGLPRASFSPENIDEMWLQAAAL